MKKLLLLAAAVCIIFASCKKSSSPDPVRDQFVGQWNWINTIVDNSPAMVSPASAGYTETLGLNANNTYVLKRNTAVVERGMYRITEDAASTAAQPVYIIKFTNRPDEQTLKFINTKFLVVRKGGANASQTIYERASE